MPTSNPEQQQAESPSVKSEVIIHGEAGQIKLVRLENLPTPEKQSEPDPRAVERMSSRLEESENESSAFTWKKTCKESGWQEPLFSFCQDYLTATSFGQTILLRSKCKDLSDLTPSQAIYISTALVRALSIYDYDHADQFSNVDTLIMEGNLLRSSYLPDNMTALEILQLGRNLGESKQLPDSQKTLTANGVCRNFSANVKAVYDALKSKQQTENYLSNCFCLIDGGDVSVFNPEYVTPDYSLSLGDKKEAPGHSWNRYILVDGDTEYQSVVDVTSARISQQAELSNYDQTVKWSFVFLFHDLDRQLFRTKDTQKRKEIIDDMFKLTSKALDTSSYPAQSAYFVNKLMLAVYNDLFLLTEMQKALLKRLVIEYMPSPEIGLDVLLKVGAEPAVVASAVKFFAEEAAKDKVVANIVINNPWLQVWIYGACSEEVIKCLEENDRKSRYNVWHFKPSSGQEQSKLTENHYQTANQFWYDLWKAHLARIAPAMVAGEKSDVVSYPTDTLRFWLDILVYTWQQISTSKSNGQRQTFTYPRDSESALRKIFTLEETQRKLESLVSEFENNPEPKKIRMSSGALDTINYLNVNKINHLIKKLDLAKNSKTPLTRF